ncbi:MAG: hypothetical protein ACOC0P_04650, partial [Planctomycetota bacterium]
TPAGPRRASPDISCFIRGSTVETAFCLEDARADLSTRRPTIDDHVAPDHLAVPSLNLILDAAADAVTAVAPTGLGGSDFEIAHGLALLAPDGPLAIGLGGRGGDDDEEEEDADEEDLDSEDNVDDDDEDLVGVDGDEEEDEDGIDADTIDDEDDLDEEDDLEDDDDEDDFWEDDDLEDDEDDFDYDEFLPDEDEDEF